MNYCLFDLALGQSGVIEEILAPFFIEERLHRLGLIRGTTITPVESAPLGSPRIYSYLHARIAIRNDLAKKIKIKYVKKN